MRRYFPAIVLVFAGAAAASYLMIRRSHVPVTMRVLLTEPCASAMVDHFDGLRIVGRDSLSIEILGFDGLPAELDQFVGFAEIRSSDADLERVRSAVRSTYLRCSATDYTRIELSDPLLAAKLRAELQRQQRGNFIGTNVRIIDGSTIEVFGAFSYER